MKKNLFWGNVLSVVIGLSLSACASGASVKFHDDSIPIDESSAVTVNIGLQITNIDDKPIMHNAIFNIALSNGWATNRWVLIPSGEHSLEGIYRGPQGSADGLRSISYNFKPGHYYFLNPEFDNNKVYISILDVTSNSTDRVRKAKKKIDNMR
jgi:hypothetical protein